MYSLGLENPYERKSKQISVIEGFKTLCVVLGLLHFPTLLYLLTYVYIGGIYVVMLTLCVAWNRLQLWSVIIIWKKKECKLYSSN